MTERTRSIDALVDAILALHNHPSEMTRDDVRDALREHGAVVVDPALVKAVRDVDAILATVDPMTPHSDYHKTGIGECLACRFAAADMDDQWTTRAALADAVIAQLEPSE